MTSQGDLFGGIEAGDVDRVRDVLSADPALAASRDDQGVSALMRARYRLDRGLVEAVRAHVGALDVFEAASFGDLDRLTQLLTGDRSLADMRSGDGFTPLHLAAFFGQDRAVAFLVGRGADVDSRGTGWMTGTPLHSAVAGSHVVVVRLLLEAGADPNARQSGGWTPLHSAARNGAAEIVRLLLAQGADDSIAADDGLDPRALAQGSGDLETIDLLKPQPRG